MLNEALAAYGLSGAEAVLLGHNENLTYRVAGQYVLRIHRAREGMSTAALDGDADAVSLRRTEMAFLRHLAAKGLHVQHPVPNLQGDDVTLLSDGTAATLLTWLAGEALTQEGCTPNICRALGGLAFQLHQAARDFRPAAARRYDRAHCDRSSAVIAGLPLEEDDKSLLLAVLAHIGGVWDSRGDSACMIHADLSPGNVLQTPKGLAPIDFSLGGMAHPMFDLAVLTAQVPVSSLGDCKAGYLAAGGALDTAAYSAGFALGVIDMIVLFGAGTVQAEWFPRTMANWRENIFRPLLDGTFNV